MDDRPLKVRCSGSALLADPTLNKSTAFTFEERDAFGLHGLLPPDVESLDTQVKRAYAAYQRKVTDIGRHITLRQLEDTNETVFYALLREHLQEMLPIIYTPTVGEACQRFSEIYRRPRGLFISYPMKDRIEEILDNVPRDEVHAIVVTDGERILGLGDQGAGGMGIPIGKLSLYSACGGIDPARTLPILLDVGTNDPDRIEDPMYLGWRNERITGQDYDDFVEAFVQAIEKKFPNVLLQWEDFAQHHAAPLLERYRDRLCTFNDDIQGTAAVVLATLLAASRVSNKRMVDQEVVVFGSGSAGCGIAEQIIRGMVHDGLSEKEARGRVYMIDRVGLLHDGMTGLLPIQNRLLQPRDKVMPWSSDGETVSLLDTVSNLHPTVLIGVSGQPRRFTEEVVRAMAAGAERPIIFPLSNPTSRVEAVPADLINWTDGRALVATGSPFGPVEYKGTHSHKIAQSNNAYIFPGLGLGILASQARRVSDAMFMAAAVELAECAPDISDQVDRLLPPVSELPAVSRRIAVAVGQVAIKEGLAPERSDDELTARVNETFWEPRYRPYERTD
ncbi:MAG: NAD-dependent malic enzyme, partial [Alphaproteobacteria bacterium]|jgi:malate dehydrogenase (oxaloacetate-decarboxylating)